VKTGSPAPPTIIAARFPGRPAGRSGAQTRARIVQAAASMFALHGFHNVSLKEIAGACGITGPAIYNHFASKDLLYIETVCTMWAEIAQAIEGPLGADLPLDAIVNRVLDTFVELYRDDGVLAKLGLEARLELARDGERFAPIAAAMHRVEAMFTEAVARGKQAGELPADTDVEEAGPLLMQLVMSGLAGRTLAAPSEVEFMRSIEAFRMLWRSGRAAAERPQLSLVSTKAKAVIPPL